MHDLLKLVWLKLQAPRRIFRSRALNQSDQSFTFVICYEIRFIISCKSTYFYMTRLCLFFGAIIVAHIFPGFLFNFLCFFLIFDKWYLTTCLIEGIWLWEGNYGISIYLLFIGWNLRIDAMEFIDFFISVWSTKSTTKLLIVRSPLRCHVPH